MKSLFITLVIFFNILFLNINFSFSNDDIDLYRVALPCAGCHSVSKGSSIPSLCGFDEKYIYTALVYYKLGKRDNYLMQIIAKGYTDKEIKKLSKYFSSIYRERNCK